MEDQTLNEYLEAIDTINRLSPAIAAFGIDAGLSTKVLGHVTTDSTSEPTPIYQLIAQIKAKPKSKEPRLTVVGFDTWFKSYQEQTKPVYRTIDGNN